MTSPAEPRVVWRPNPGPQTRFLASTADEVLYGGAAGGGKSAASVAMPLRWVHNRAFRCLFLRRESLYLADAIDKSSALYPGFGARFVQTPKKIWHFPSGAQVWLHHCQTDKDIRNFDSQEFHLIIFEELTHFTEKQYTQIRNRIRGTDPTLPRYIRATTNPGGEGHEWVFKRFAAWLDPKNDVRARPNEVLRFIRDPDGKERVVPPGTPGSLSRQFIPARKEDNPHIAGDYEAILNSEPDPVRRAQLASGDWLIQPGKGIYFKRTWIRDWIPARPVRNVVRRVRAWDFGATENGDWSRGALGCSLTDGSIVVEDMASLHSTPGNVQKFVLSTAQMDGRGVIIRLPLDPGQAGLDQKLTYAKMLQGFHVEWERPTGEKATRFAPFSSQAEAGNVAVVQGPWNEAWVLELEAFPESRWDDQVDATADMFTRLTRGNTVKRTDGSGDSNRTMEGWA